MTSFYPPSTVAYPLLNQLLYSLMPLPVPSTASEFSLTSTPVSSCDAAATTTSLPVSSETATTSTSTLPPISSLMTAPKLLLHPSTHLLLILLRLHLTLQLFLSLFCHKAMSPLHPIYRNTLASVSSPTICNPESPVISNVHNCPQVKLVHPSAELSTLLCINRNFLNIIKL